MVVYGGWDESGVTRWWCGVGRNGDHILLVCGGTKWGSIQVGWNVGYILVGSNVCHILVGWNVGHILVGWNVSHILVLYGGTKWGSINTGVVWWTK